jgi:hypothetical protein
VSELTQEAVQKRIQIISNQLAAEFVILDNDPHLQSVIRKWDPTIRKICEESRKKPEVVIALVGGTGAGKSTLLNSILDQRILPVSNMRACTAAVTEVSYIDNGYYNAHVEFMNRRYWQEEIKQLKEDLRDEIKMQADNSFDEDGNKDEACAISRVARDKLKAVYRLPDDFKYTLENIEALKEDEEISRLLNGGRIDIKERDFKKFKKGIALCLDSKHRYWPIVTRVSVSGPFDILSDGVKIVDLPGINDPNQAREAVTHNYIKNCSFVWIVFNIKRVITKDTMKLMQSDDFMRQILMDGRADSLTFVGTASDDIDVDTACEEFGLDEDTPEYEIVLHRNREVRKEVKKQLEDMSIRMIKLADENSQRCRALVDTIEKSKIFTVSAREYMRLKGLSRTRSGVLEDVSQSEIQQLKEHLGNVSHAYGIEAQARSHHNKLDLFVRELKREAGLCIESFENKLQMSKRQKEEVQRAVDTADKFLREKTNSIKEIYIERLKANQEVLLQRLAFGFDRGKQGIDNLSYYWRGMHWATMRAVARRGGRFVGSTGKHDFSADISKPVMDSIMFQWSDFFGDKMDMVIDGVFEKLLLEFQKNISDLLTTVTKIMKIEDDVHESFDRLFDTSQRILKELAGQAKDEIKTRIGQTRKTLYEKIEGEVDLNMQIAYKKAAEESGSGMKQRMISSLADHAKDVADTMFQDAREQISQGVRQLCDYLLRKYDNMSSTVIKQSKIAHYNLLMDSEELSPEEVSSKKQQLNELIKYLEQI